MSKSRCRHLADSVRGRVTIGAIAYRKAHDCLGRAWIAIDGHEILNMASIVFDYEHYRLTAAGSDNEAARQALHERGTFGEHDCGVLPALCAQFGCRSRGTLNVQ